MKNVLKGMLVCLVFVLACMVVYSGWYYYKDKNKDTSNNNPQPVSSTTNTTTVNNDQKDEPEKIEEKTDNKKEDEPEEKKTEPEEEKKEENNKEEVSLNDEDKAIEMAKKQYGTTDGVYFRIEQIQSNGVYIISVRDNETTRDYAWYTVDVKNNTVK